MKVSLKAHLQPSIVKAVIIGFLLFTEGIAISAYAVLQTGRMPTEVEWTTFFIGALIQLVTYFLTFLGYEPTTTTTTETKPSGQ